MKCPKIDWCEFAHYDCNRFRKDNPVFSCHKEEKEPFKPVIVVSKEGKQDG